MRAYFTRFDTAQRIAVAAQRLGLEVRVDGYLDANDFFAGWKVSWA